MVEIRKSHQILVGNPEMERTLRRHTRRHEDNIKIDLDITDIG
jgi:hypothetical protein